MLENFFKGENIEYYALLDYASCNEISHEIIARESLEAKSVIVFLIPYYVSVPKNLSIYAASLDYHIYVKDVTDRLIARLKEKFPGGHFKGYGDHSPIDERDAAVKGGLGILGDSKLVINEKYGTYVFIADVISDVEASLIGTPVNNELLYCHHCGACRNACPTGILKGCSDLCLSAITQRKGDLTEKEIELMRKVDTVWGCDVCQQVCPYNKKNVITPIEFFHRDRIELLTSEKFAALSNVEFKNRAFGWRGRSVVQRNLELLNY